MARQSVRPIERIVCGKSEQVVEADEDVEEEVAEHGRRELAKLKDPKLPSKAEVEYHNLSHLPYRSCCKHCVRGRGKELPHTKSKRETDMHEFHVDWAFPGEEEAGKTLSVMVVRMRNTQMTMRSPRRSPQSSS